MPNYNQLHMISKYFLPLNWMKKLQIPLVMDIGLDLLVSILNHLEQIRISSPEYLKINNIPIQN